MIYESTAADVGWDERRLRFLLARGWAGIPPFTSALLVKARRPAVRQPRRVQAGPPAQALGDPRRGLPDDDRRLPGARRADLLGAGSPRRTAKRRRRPARALVETARAAGFSRVIDVTDAFDGLDPARLAVDPTTSIPTPRAMPGSPSGSTTP